MDGAHIPRHEMFICADSRPLKMQFMMADVIVAVFRAAFFLYRHGSAGVFGAMPDDAQMLRGYALTRFFAVITLYLRRWLIFVLLFTRTLRFFFFSARNRYVGLSAARHAASEHGMISIFLICRFPEENMVASLIIVCVSAFGAAPARAFFYAPAK